MYLKDETVDELIRSTYINSNYGRYYTLTLHKLTERRMYIMVAEVTKSLTNADLVFLFDLNK